MALIRHGLKLRPNLRTYVPTLKRWSLRVRSRHLFVLDALGMLVASLMAISAWVDAPIDRQILEGHAWIVGIVVFSQLAVNILFGLYKTSWRFASIHEMWRVLACGIAGMASAGLIVLGILALDPPTATGMPPTSFWMVQTLLTLIVMAGPRFLIRSITELNDQAQDGTVRERTLLYGAGWAGVMIARSADRDPDSGVLPVGFLDDNLDLRGRSVVGLRVYGDVTALAEAKRATDAESLLITMPRASGSSVRRVVDAAVQHGLDVRTVPPVTDLIDGTIDASQTRQIRVEDLLRRPPATEHAPALRHLLSGHTVMITGAAGSIGSELVRQVLALGPARIAMVDQAESAMYMVARDLERRSQVMKGTTTITTHLVDVVDRESVRKLMRDTRPVVVFHAAAYKHVPMLEEHASQAVLVNVGGTKSVIDAAIEHDVERFVLVSTDKAVEPSSVMGATKRLAEMIVADAAQRTGRAYASVRFGNVLGSNGSVIPVFQSQLEQGQPLTVTDPQMTRFFMTIPEASWLILDAAAICESGCLYVLDMGEPVRLMDLATDLIRLSGKDPETVPIRFTGLRPGEKLHEELFYSDEEVTPTDVPKVLRSVNAVRLPATFLEDVQTFVSMAHAGRDEALRSDVLTYLRDTASPDRGDLVGQWGETIAATSEGNGERPAVVAVPIHTQGHSARSASTTPSAGNGQAAVANGHRRAQHGAMPGTNGEEHAEALNARYLVPPPVVVPDGTGDPDALADANEREAAEPR